MSPPVSRRGVLVGTAAVAIAAVGGLAKPAGWLGATRMFPVADAWVAFDHVALCERWNGYGYREGSIDAALPAGAPPAA